MTQAVTRFRPKQPSGWQQYKRWAFTISFFGIFAVSLLTIGGRPTLYAVMLILSLISLVNAGLEMYWRLYGRRSPEAKEEMGFPKPVKPGEERLTFSLIVPALHEAGVMEVTLCEIARQTHGKLEIVASLCEDDVATLEACERARKKFPHLIKIVVERYKKSSKPQQLNRALKECTGDVVGVFDAEDAVAHGLLAAVEALFNKTGADVVQGGVQLTNLDLRIPDNAKFWQRVWIYMRSWFCVHNVMEYFFWFSSRMFLQAKIGFVPLGGNTLFIRRDLLEKAGGWPLNLTEDCALGVLISTQFKANIVVAFDPELTTQEETPDGIFGKGRWLKQRLRWDTGFLTVYMEKQLKQLDTLSERLMARYILAMPFVQAFNAVVLFFSLITILTLKAPVGLVMISYLPLLAFAINIMVQLVGLREFCREFNQKAYLRHYVSLVLGAYPYQLLLALAAVLSVRKFVIKDFHWDKTSHSGLHRQPQRGQVRAAGVGFVLPHYVEGEGVA